MILGYLVYGSGGLVVNNSSFSGRFFILSLACNNIGFIYNNGIALLSDMEVHIVVKMKKRR